jgi:hypothetical protein
MLSEAAHPASSTVEEPVLSLPKEPASSAIEPAQPVPFNLSIPLTLAAEQSPLSLHAAADHVRYHASSPRRHPHFPRMNTALVPSHNPHLQTISTAHTQHPIQAVAPPRERGPFPGGELQVSTRMPPASLSTPGVARCALHPTQQGRSNGPDADLRRKPDHRRLLRQR